MRCLYISLKTHCVYCVLYCCTVLPCLYGTLNFTARTVLYHTVLRSLYGTLDYIACFVAHSSHCVVNFTVYYLLAMLHALCRPYGDLFLWGLWGFSIICCRTLSFHANTLLFVGLDVNTLEIWSVLSQLLDHGWRVTKKEIPKFLLTSRLHSPCVCFIPSIDNVDLAVHPSYHLLNSTPTLWTYCTSYLNP